MTSEKNNAPTWAGAKENVQANPTSLGDLVQAQIDGQRLADQIICEVRSSFPDPDRLYGEVQSLLPDVRDVAALSRLRGICRRLQKELERTVRAAGA